MKHLFFFQSLRPNVFTMEFVKKKLQHKRLLTEKGSFPSWTDIICSFKSCFVSQLVTQYHIYRVSFLYELRQYRHSNVDISPAIPLPSSAGSALRHAKPILGLVFWVQDDPQRKKFGSNSFNPTSQFHRLLWCAITTRAICALLQKVHHIQSNWKVFQSNRFFFYLCQIRKAPATLISPPVLTLRYANPSCLRVGAKRPPHSIT